MQNILREKYWKSCLNKSKLKMKIFIPCKYHSISNKAGNTPKVVYNFPTCHRSAKVKLGQRDFIGNAVLKRVIW